MLCLLRFTDLEASHVYARGTGGILWDDGDGQLVIAMPAKGSANHPPESCDVVCPVRVWRLDRRDEDEAERLLRRGAEIWYLHNATVAVMPA